MRLRRAAAAVALLAATALVLAGCIALPGRRADRPGTPTVAIDAGHGGQFSNAGPDGLAEEDVNLDIAKRLRSELEKRGYRVIMTRESDTDFGTTPIPTWGRTSAAPDRWTYALEWAIGSRQLAKRRDLQARVNAANAAGADIFVSVHNNATDNTKVSGTEAFAAPNDEAGQALAASIVDAASAKAGTLNRGSHTSGLYVCRWTNMPAALVEGAYLTNAADARMLRSRGFRRRMAQGIADGIDRWFDVYPLPESAAVDGADSASLAVAASRSAFPKGARAAVLLAENQPELSASAGALAARLRGPVLLAGRSGLSSATSAELKRLGARTVIVVGARFRFDPKRVAEAAQRASAGAEVVSASGDTLPTAAAAAASLSVGSVSEVAIVDVRDTGALRAAAPYVAAVASPVLLSRDGKLDSASESFLARAHKSGAAVLRIDSARDAARPVGLNATTVERKDPDALAARLLARAYPPKTGRPSDVVVVDVASPVDVACASTFSAHRRTPLVLVDDGVLGPWTREFLVNRVSPRVRITALRNRGSAGPQAQAAIRKSVAR